MGSTHTQSIQNIAIQDTPIYCIGFSSDIHFAAQDASTNQILAKLKEYKGSKAFKYRIRSKPQFQYFYQYAQSLIVVKPLNKENAVLGIMKMSSSYQIKTQSLMAILRKQMRIQQKESIFLSENGKLCQIDQTIGERKVQNMKASQKISVLYYQKMQIFG